jgi:hypothetical protein
MLKIKGKKTNHSAPTVSLLTKYSAIFTPIGKMFAVVVKEIVAILANHNCTFLNCL